MSNKAPTRRPAPTRLASRIEIIRTQDAPPDIIPPSTLGIDESIIENLEELLEKMENADLSFGCEPVESGDVATITKKIQGIERRLKECEAESAALKMIWMKLH